MTTCVNYCVYTHSFVNLLDLLLGVFQKDDDLSLTFADFCTMMLDLIQYLNVIIFMLKIPSVFVLYFTIFSPVMMIVQFSVKGYHIKSLNNFMAMQSCRLLYYFCFSSKRWTV